MRCPNMRGKKREEVLFSAISLSPRPQSRRRFLSIRYWLQCLLFEVQWQGLENFDDLYKAVSVVVKIWQGEICMPSGGYSSSAI